MNIKKIVISAFMIGPLLSFGLTQREFFKSVSDLTEETPVSAYINVNYKGVQKDTPTYHAIQQLIYYQIIPNTTQKLSLRGHVPTRWLTDLASKFDIVYRSEKKYASKDELNTLLQRIREVKTVDDDKSLVTYVKQRIYNNYYTGVDLSTLNYGAISGMMSSLNDPYSQFFTPEEAKKFVSGLESTYGGIGISINGNKVGKVFENTPAANAGIQKGDTIISVDGKAYVPNTTFMGEIGTTVVIVLERDGKQRTVSIERKKIDIPTVSTGSVNGIPLISIMEFGYPTSQEFIRAFSQLSGSNHMIIDLRGNPGGDVEVVGSVIETFVGSGTELYTLKSKYDSMTALSQNLRPWTGSLAILVDNDTASAAEMMSLNLQQHGALVVGQQTFGKGVAQIFEILSDNSAIKFTSSQWFIGGKSIDKKGVTPNYLLSKDFSGTEQFAAQLLQK